MGQKHRSSNYCRCDVNKRQGHFGGKKNDKLMSKTLLNLVGTEKENQDRKDLVVVQSSRNNLCNKWCIGLLYL